MSNGGVERETTGGDYASLPYHKKAAVDDICDRYEAHFLAGKRPNTAECLQNVDPSISPVLIQELFAVDIAHRDDPIDVIRMEYVHQFPTLSRAIDCTTVADVSLSTGDTLGEYRIVRQIGRGGMGVVYEAEDIELERRVALKFLPTAFAKDRGWLERFRREAKILAGLNHPNIATLHAFEEYRGRHFCVLEYVPGRTLSEMLRRKPLPVREALPVFTQIATALEFAHESGVIHRDLKPANIKVTDDGVVKVLDFGLATSRVSNEENRLLAQHVSDEGDLVLASWRKPSTHATTIAGTLPYMSPEQVAGERVDKRSDIWAFGCCLYEALSGRRAFSLSNPTELSKAVLEKEPDWSALPNDTPPPITRLIQRCLRKDSRQRLRDIGDARIELGDDQRNPSAETKATPRGAFWRRAFLATAVIGLLAATATIVLRRGSSKETIESRTSINLPEGLELRGTPNGRHLALSPDGSLLVFSATNETGESHLYIRKRASFQIRQLAGTLGACSPFFSPNGQQVGFFTSDSGSQPNCVKTISITGGDARLICRSTGPIKGGCWTPEDEILFASSWGGAVEAVDADGSNHRTLSYDRAVFPQLLPDGRTLLCEKGRMFDASNRACIQPKLALPTNPDFVRFLPSGHLIYSTGGSLYQVNAEQNPLRIVGTPQLLAQTDFEKIDFAVSALGDIVFAPASDHSRLVWKNRKTGAETVAWSGTRKYGSFRLSPDAKKLAVSVAEGDGSRLWIHDFTTDTSSLLTSQGKSQRPIWLPDGESIVFRWSHADRSGLASKKLGSLEPPSWLSLEQNPVSAASAFRNGKGAMLVAYTSRTEGFFDIFQLNLQDRTKRLLRHSAFDEAFGQLSPDGRWFLYLSTKDTGAYEAFVSDYPDFAETHRVSKAGALDPMWSPSGDAIYYRAGDRNDEIVAATVALDPFRVIKTETVCAGTADCPGYSFDYDSANDRFLVIKSIEDSPPRNEIHWLQNSVR